MELNSGYTHRLGYRPVLDGIRGVAMLSVFLFNMGWTGFKGGYYGVDIFFVLSGFLITTLLCEEWLRRGDIRVGNFFYRRALRLLPALLALVMVTSLFSVVMHSGGKRQRQLLEGVATLLYVVNWTTLLKVAKGGGLAHCWSLAAEGQFYVVWVFLIRYLLRGREVIQGLKRVVVTSLCIAIGCLLWRVLRWSHGTPWYWLYLGTDCRLDSMFTGCALGALRLLALHSNGVQVSFLRARGLVELFVPISFVSVGILFCTSEVESRWTYFVGFPLISLCTGLWIWSGLLGSKAPGLKVLETPILVWMGRISYSLYLWHYCVFSVLNGERLESWGIGGFKGDVLRGIVSLAIACFSYYVIESWFLRRREQAREG